MPGPSSLRSLRTLGKVLGGALALATLLLVLRNGPELPLATASPAPRVSSPGELALEGRPTGEALPPRDRLVAMENMHTREKVVFYVGPGGQIRSDQTPTLERLFRCQRTERKAPISPQLLELLADIAERWPGRMIELLSGLRTPPFGAPHSKHFIGQAIDLRVRGLRSTEVRDFVWREHRGVGVGYYPEGDFVHVDSRPPEQEIAWSGRQESTRLEYHPRWASQARQDPPTRQTW